MPPSSRVALRKESVDRNISCMTHTQKFCVVALRKESVDRNILLMARLMELLKSLSARRAWIEMTQGVFNLFTNPGVALRKESVDRNTPPKVQALAVGRSLSARRAWIEMDSQFGIPQPLDCRSPQGERG